MYMYMVVDSRPLCRFALYIRVHSLYSRAVATIGAWGPRPSLHHQSVCPLQTIGKLKY